MQHVSVFPSLLPENNVDIHLQPVPHLSALGTGRLVGDLASRQEGQQERETYFFFDVTCYTWGDRTHFALMLTGFGPLRL